MDITSILFFLGLGGILFGTIQDLRTREVANWLTLCLLLTGLVFRYFAAIQSGDAYIFWSGVIGTGVFFILGMACYYGRLFAGGDA